MRREADVNYLKKIRKPLTDFIYSLAAYALPTVVLQFVVFPVIAGNTTPDANGLFLALFNAVRLCVSLFTVPLANMRLLKKKDCIEEPDKDKGFNLLFLTVTGMSALIVLGFGIFYYGNGAGVFDMVRLLLVLILLSAHDYYAIAFRVNITYKTILADNIMIVVGYLIGIPLMLKTGYWELIIICGYALGLAFTLIKTSYWRRGVKANLEGKVIGEYAQLSASSGLNTATTYCDKMLIYPMIGGYNVSVYNSAAIVSKLMTLISVPMRNVFLSYIVDTDKLSLSRKRLGKLGIISLAGTGVLYGGFYLASLVLCRVLYPQYYGAALKYIPIILLAILFETYSGLLKVYLLRFEKTSLQVITSAIKVAAYLAGVLILTVFLKTELTGFCLSILIADALQFIIVLYFFIKNIMKQVGGKKDVS